MLTSCTKLKWFLEFFLSLTRLTPFPMDIVSRIESLKKDAKETYATLLIDVSTAAAVIQEEQSEYLLEEPAGIYLHGVHEPLLIDQQIYYSRDNRTGESYQIKTCSDVGTNVYLKVGNTARLLFQQRTKIDCDPKPRVPYRATKIAMAWVAQELSTLSKWHGSSLVDHARTVMEQYREHYQAASSSSLLNVTDDELVQIIHTAHKDTTPMEERLRYITEMIAWRKHQVDLYRHYETLTSRVDVIMRACVGEKLDEFQPSMRYSKYEISIASNRHIKVKIGIDWRAEEMIQAEITRLVSQLANMDS